MDTSDLPIYLDCNATTPIDPAVQDAMRPFFEAEWGNAGSRTHEFGVRARQAVEKARRAVAEVVQGESDEIVFTSGATESSNLAILGLSDHGLKSGNRHIVTSKIEHKAVLEPIEEMERRGFEVTYLTVDRRGVVDPAELSAALRVDTLLVSLMHVNNETGTIQPLEEIWRALEKHACYLHVDAAQSFGKIVAPLRSSRIDLISISSHKIFGPKGVGALVARRRRFKKPPLKPLHFGGGQERGLRPGTLPVPLIVGLGEAATQALSRHEDRRRRCEEIRRKALTHLDPLKPRFHGDLSQSMAHTLNLGFPGIDGEAAMVALKDLVSLSNGSACTSTSYEPSHVLIAMGYSSQEAQEALRFSWSHLTPDVPWDQVALRIRQLA